MRRGLKRYPQRPQCPQSSAILQALDLVHEYFQMGVQLSSQHKRQLAAANRLIEMLFQQFADGFAPRTRVPAGRPAAGNLASSGRPRSDSTVDHRRHVGRRELPAGHFFTRISSTSASEADSSSSSSCSRNRFWKSSSLPGELGGVLDRRSDQAPPHLEPGLARRVARRA